MTLQPLYFSAYIFFTIFSRKIFSLLFSSSSSSPRQFLVLFFFQFFPFFYLFPPSKLSVSLLFIGGRGNSCLCLPLLLCRGRLCNEFCRGSSANCCRGYSLCKFVAETASATNFAEAALQILCRGSAKNLQRGRGLPRLHSFFFLAIWSSNINCFNCAPN